MSATIDQPIDAPSANQAPVEAPILKSTKDEKSTPLIEALKADESIKRFGKFHLGRHTIWWAVSELPFGSTVIMDGPGQTEVTRLTYLEFSRVQEGLRILHRLICGRLIVFHSR